MRTRALGTEVEDFTAQHLRVRYIVALLLIAILTLVSQAVIQVSIADQEHDSRIVNIAGRQRMLSQKITKTCYYIAEAESAEAREGYRNQLEEALGLWQRSHAGLQRGDPEFGLPGKNSAQVMILFKGIEANHQAMISAAQQVLAAPDSQMVLRRATQIISANEPKFLPGMDAIVFRYDAEAKERVSSAKYLEIGLAIITLLVLVLEARFIFAPAVSRLRRDMREREQREADMETLFSASPTAMLLIDEASLAIIQCNRKTEDLMGCAAEGILQREISEFLDAKHETNRRFLEKVRSGDALSEYEILLIDAQSTSVEALVSSCRLTFAGRHVYVLGVTNITELKKAQQTLQYYATFDEMTGLVNRRTGLMLLDKEVERAQRKRIALTVCYADLDGLKAVNDRYGHHEGDWMIRTMSKVLSDSIRKGDVAMRLGGDEFMLMLHECPEAEAKLLLGRIETRLSDISSAEQKPFTLGVSFGLALYDLTRHANAAELIADADSRMYEAKQARKSAKRALL